MPPPTGRCGLPWLRVQRQTGLGEEAVDEVGPVLDLLEPPASVPPQVAGGCHHDGVVLAIWPSLINPAVRLVMFGIGFTLGGLGALAMLREGGQTRRQRRAAYRTSMEKIGSVLGLVAAAVFLVVGIASIAVGMTHLR